MLCRSLNLISSFQAVFVHPEFKPLIKYHDIALIELETSVKFSTYVWPACVHPEFNYPKEENLIIAGFGRNMKDSELKHKSMMF